MCSYQKEHKKLNKPQDVYAAFTQNEKLIKKSASGGIFASIAEEFIKQGGIVYGSAMQIENGKATVNHIRVDDIANLYKLQGSKYVQSDLKEIYGPIKKDLELGKKVLFSGTPCQVDAINKFVNDEKLLTIDIICHGVPNNKMFNDYINTLEKKENSKILDFSFRDKSREWGRFASYIENKKNKVVKEVKPACKLSYYQLFLDAKIFRENCYSCPFAQELRIGDITLGDFWNVETEHSKFAEKVNIKNGVSCVLINTEKGKRIVKNFAKDIFFIESSIDKIKKHNSQLIKPRECPSDRNKILSLYKHGSFEKVNKEYVKKNYFKILIKSFWYRIPLSTRTKIKNIVK